MVAKIAEAAEPFVEDAGIDNAFPRSGATERIPITEALAELQRLRVMERRLLDWTADLEAKSANPGTLGRFIATELRNRMRGG